MFTHELRMKGPGAKGLVVDATMLRDVLATLIDGSQRALKIRTQGRSTARGKAPQWILKASDFKVQVRSGSTVLDIDAPTLLEADPQDFGQTDSFPELDPNLTGLDYFIGSISAALDGQSRTDAYDIDFLKLLQGLSSVFEKGIDSIDIAGCNQPDKPVRIVPTSLERLDRLIQEIPQPQRVRVAGKLDTIRHTDHTFTLVLETGERLRGIAEKSDDATLARLWSSPVLVSGTAHFGSSGRPLRIEADSIQPATPEDKQLWSDFPQPGSRRLAPAELRQPQGPKTGLNAIIGKWPGDETDDEVAASLEQMS